MRIPCVHNAFDDLNVFTTPTDVDLQSRPPHQGFRQASEQWRRLTRVHTEIKYQFIVLKMLERGNQIISLHLTIALATMIVQGTVSQN